LNVSSKTFSVAILTSIDSSKEDLTLFYDYLFYYNLFLICYWFRILRCLRDSSICFSGVFSFWLMFITLHIKIFFEFSYISEPIYLSLNFYLTSLLISICFRILSLKVSYILKELSIAVVLYELDWLLRMNEFLGVCWTLINEFYSCLETGFPSLAKFNGIPFLDCFWMFLLRSLL